MPEELGEIAKPSVEDFKKGRRLFFIPLTYGGKEFPTEYLETLKKYWKQVEEQLGDLELKLGPVSRIYHELVPSTGKEGVKAIKALNNGSYQIVESRVEKGVQLEAAEDSELLTEFMDWSRCLAIGLQNQKVLSEVYESYTEAGRKRNEFIAKHIDETLQPEEIGILFMREGNQVQLPSEIEIFYVAPPALDEINRWLRDSESQPLRKRRGRAVKKEGN